VNTGDRESHDREGTDGVLVTERNMARRKSVMTSVAMAAMVTTVKTATIQTPVI
jgi:hypothetical protein